MREKAKVVPIDRGAERAGQRPVKRQPTRRFEPDNRLFGAVLASRRGDLGLTQQQVVVGVGRSPSWLSYYERGRFRKLPEMGDLHALCAVLGLAVLELLVESGFVDRGSVVEAARATDLRRRRA